MQEGCGTGRERNGWCSMSMARGKPPANELCLAHLISQPHSADCKKFAHLAIRGASGEKWSGPHGHSPSSHASVGGHLLRGIWGRQR